MAFREVLIICVCFAVVCSAVYLSWGGGGGGEPIENVVSILENHEAGGKLDVYHWWTAGGEKESIDAALGVFGGEYPNISTISNPIPGGAGGAMVMKVKVLVAAGDAPESFQAHPGLEIWPYYEANTLYKLNDIWEYAGLENRVMEWVADLCKAEGDYYLVPIGIHKTNVVWYNKHMFDEYGVEPLEDPVTWDDFWALCDELQSKLPRGKYPLALGDRMGWPGTHVFETIMMGTDPQTYEDFINGEATTAQLEPVMERFKKFMSYVPPDHTARLWYESAGRVCAGDYAMYLHGCWIKGFFASREWVYGIDYGAFSAPGTFGWFGVSVDAFTVPKGSDNPANGFRWAYMCSDPEVQEAFCPVKECISPYEDTPLSVYSEGTRVLAEELRDPGIRIYPSFTHGTAIPWSVLMDLHSRISEFTTTSDPDISRHARLIAQALAEAEIHGGWDIV